MNIYGQRPIEDTLSALIFDNLFGRFPGLNVLVAEHGAEWVPFFVRHMDKSRGMGRNGPWIGGKLTERPSQIFKRHVRVVPYPEDDIPAIVDSLGYDDCLVMGSDFPHAEGLAEPADFVKLLDPLDDAAKRRIMRDNADQLLQPVSLIAMPLGPDPDDGRSRPRDAACLGARFPFRRAPAELDQRPRRDGLDSALLVAEEHSGRRLAAR